MEAFPDAKTRVPDGRREGAEYPPPGRRFTSRNRRFAPLPGGLGQRRQAEGLAGWGFDFRDGFSLLKYIRTGTSAWGLESSCPIGVPNRQKTPCPCALEIGGAGGMVVGWGSRLFLPINNVSGVRSTSSVRRVGQPGGQLGTCCLAGEISHA